MSLVDPTTVIYRDVNAAWSRFFGIPADVARGRTGKDLGIRTDEERRASFLDAARRVPFVQGLQFELVIPTGAKRVVLATAETIRLGPEPLLLTTLVDITDRIRLEEDLRRKNEELNQMAAILDEAEAATRRGSWEWDLDADRARWSAGMYRLFGVDARSFENTNENFLALVHPQDRQAMMASMQKALTDGGRFFQEYRLIRPDGSLRRLRGEGAVVPDAQGKPRRMFGVVEDVTDAATPALELQSRIERAAQREHRQRVVVEDTVLVFSQGLTELRAALKDQQDLEEALATTRRLQDALEGLLAAFVEPNTGK